MEEDIGGNCEKDELWRREGQGGAQSARGVGQVCARA